MKKWFPIKEIYLKNFSCKNPEDIVVQIDDPKTDVRTNFKFRTNTKFKFRYHKFYFEITPDQDFMWRAFTLKAGSLIHTYYGEATIFPEDGSAIIDGKKLNKVGTLGKDGGGSYFDPKPANAFDFSAMEQTYKKYLKEDENTNGSFLPKGTLANYGYAGPISYEIMEETKLGELLLPKGTKAWISLNLGYYQIQNEITYKGLVFPKKTYFLMARQNISFIAPVSIRTPTQEFSAYKRYPIENTFPNVAIASITSVGGTPEDQSTWVPESGKFDGTPKDSDPFLRIKSDAMPESLAVISATNYSYALKSNEIIECPPNEELEQCKPKFEYRLLNPSIGTPKYYFNHVDVIQSIKFKERKISSFSGSIVCNAKKDTKHKLSWKYDASKKNFSWVNPCNSVEGSAEKFTAKASTYSDNGVIKIMTDDDAYYFSGNNLIHQSSDLGENINVFQIISNGKEYYYIEDSKQKEDKLLRRVKYQFDDDDEIEDVDC